MTYEKPEVIDFGSIVENTYWGGDFWASCFPGGSGDQIVRWHSDD